MALYKLYIGFRTASGKKVLGLVLCAFALKLRILRCSRERDHITDIGHPRHKLNHSLKSESEACMRNSTKTPGIKIPPHLIDRDMHFNHSFLQHIKSFFSL